MSIVAVRLRTDAGHSGWGYGECCSKGVFHKPAWYIQPLPALLVLKTAIQQIWWPQLENRHPIEAWRGTRFYHSPYSFVDAAIRMALWDLMAQEAELPLFRYLGGDSKANRVPAYGSLLDFPLTEEQAVGVARNFLKLGFRTIKVKVGAAEVERDVKRLQAIRAAIGDSVELTADANTAWTCDEAISRLRIFQQEGVKLAYIEDPLSPDDVAGLARLRQESDVRVIGHDYVSQLSQVRALLASGGLSLLRITNHIDFGIACADLSVEYGVPMSFCNTVFERNVHLAVAFPNVDRFEFSDLAWNKLLRSPVRFEDGYGIAPLESGHGLVPDFEALQEFSRPEE
jgi:L-alanine-DL-glutamate epimerase-like enolase superfamily enzyme